MPENLYRRGRTFWARARVLGQEVRRSLRTADAAEARRRLAAFREDVARERAFAHRNTAWSLAVGRYVSEEAPMAVSPRTLERYCTSLRVASEYFAPFDVHQITLREINAFITWRRANRRLGTRPLTNATLRRDLSVITNVLRSCLALGEIDANPMRDFDWRRLREAPREGRLPTDAEVDALIAACPAPLSDIAALLADTGMRLMEAVALEWRSVTEQDGRIELTLTDLPLSFSSMRS